MLEELAGARVLVTGAGGFLGAYVCDRLAEVAEVHGVSRGLRAGSDRLTWWQADLVDEAAVDDVVRHARPDVIIHLGGRVSGTRERSAVLPMLRANLVGTVNVLMTALTHETSRVVIAGSMEEPLETQRDDDDVLQSPYAASKWAATGYAQMCHALYDAPVVTLHIAVVYGPGQPDENKLIPYVIRSLLSGEAPRVSSGTRAVDWIYVDDAVDAIVRAASAGGITGSVIDVGSGVLTTIREIVERLVALVDSSVEPVFGALPDRPFERSRAADVEDAAHVLGWRAGISLDEGLRRTVEACRLVQHPGGRC